MKPPSLVAAGFTLLEMLVSTAVFAAILIAMLSLLNMTSRTYQSVSGKVDVFESARTAFDTLSRTVRQATIQSYLGYDDPRAPTKYQRKSDLHFISGKESNLNLAGVGGSYAPHAVFFQAPLGIVSSPTLEMANGLLCSTGFFLDYGPELNRPAVLGGKTPVRHRFRLLQFVQPKEEMDVYSRTLTQTTADGKTFPISNEAYDATDWFAQTSLRKNCHVLAENVVALAILPVFNGTAANYLWDSRDPTKQSSFNRLPHALKVTIAVIDEASAIRMDLGATPPSLIPSTLFSDPDKYDSDVRDLEAHLSQYSPKVNYRIYSTEIPLDASVGNL